ncbi:response regulator [Shewanella sp.]|uniref:response regulator n=1 Tax=Shewanella sp. TaxID=50422 RepID=UPI000C10E8F1|nr:response regulator [Shewanella sp.]MBL4814057.1 response regulator [Shewanella sp.]MCJ8304640.1 response regulator [Shewanella sp.]PHQ73162.1 MAG: response regulator [Shewanella sp.]PHQ73684.1 MAG: response regulator [Shewanella sp.]
MEKVRVLIVDDDPVCSSQLLAILADDYHVTTVNSGNDVIAMSNLLRPNIIFLDVMMSETNGYQILKRFKNNLLTLGTPVIIITALTGMPDIKLAQQLGADGYLCKPITLRAAVEIMDKYKPWHPRR